MEAATNLSDIPAHFLAKRHIRPYNPCYKPVSDQIG
jgi:hypothetical protein